MDATPPGPRATRAQLAAHIAQLHRCVDENHKETLDFFAAARWRSLVQIGALAGVVVSVLTLAGAMLSKGAELVMWAEHVDGRLAALETLGCEHTRRLDNMSLNLRQLRGLPPGAASPPCRTETPS